MNVNELLEFEWLYLDELWEERNDTHCLRILIVERFKEFVDVIQNALELGRVFVHGLCHDLVTLKRKTKKLEPFSHLNSLEDILAQKFIL